MPRRSGANHSIAVVPSRVASPEARSSRSICAKTPRWATWVGIIGHTVAFVADPPSIAYRSMTTTERPSCAQRIAQAEPADPPPTTATS